MTRSELAVVGRAYASGAGASSAWLSKFSTMHCVTSSDSSTFFGSTPADVVFIAGFQTTRHCNSRTTSGKLSWAGSMSLRVGETWRRRSTSVCPTVLYIHHSSESTSLENVIGSGELDTKKSRHRHHAGRHSGLHEASFRVSSCKVKTVLLEKNRPTCSLSCLATQTYPLV